MSRHSRRVSLKKAMAPPKVKIRADCEWRSGDDVEDRLMRLVLLVNHQWVRPVLSTYYGGWESPNHLILTDGWI